MSMFTPCRFHFGLGLTLHILIRIAVWHHGLWYKQMVYTQIYQSVVDLQWLTMLTKTASLYLPLLSVKVTFHPCSASFEAPSTSRPLASCDLSATVGWCGPFWLAHCSPFPCDVTFPLIILSDISCCTTGSRHVDAIARCLINVIGLVFIKWMCVLQFFNGVH